MPFKDEESGWTIDEHGGQTDGTGKKPPPPDQPPKNGGPPADDDLRHKDNRPKPDGNMPEYIGRYRVERELGRGGFGIVYLAFDETQLKRYVAIKVPHKKHLIHPKSADAYLTEARIVAKLRPGTFGEAR